MSSMRDRYCMGGEMRGSARRGKEREVLTIAKPWNAWAINTVDCPHVISGLDEVKNS